VGQSGDQSIVHKSIKVSRMEIIPSNVLRTILSPINLFTYFELICN